MDQLPPPSPVQQNMGVAQPPEPVGNEIVAALAQSIAEQVSKALLPMLSGGQVPAPPSGPEPMGPPREARLADLLGR